VKADAEWGKLGQVPGLVDGWTDVKDKAGIATEEFKAGNFCGSACGSHATIFPLKHTQLLAKVYCVSSCRSQQWQHMCSWLSRWVSFLRSPLLS